MVGWEYGSRPLGPKEIDGLLVSSGKAYTLLNDHLNRSSLSLPRKRGSSQTIHTYKPLRLSWMVIFQAFVGCHAILILGKSPIKWRQRPDMTLAVDWDVKHQFKQTKLFKHTILLSYQFHSCTLKWRFNFQEFLKSFPQNSHW